ncbi:MAG TPA: CoA transferase, partial [Mesorhizobium sp.]|nr:CoA transferase [Mesorhizobium sp.]
CFRGRKASEWIERLESRGIPCGPIASIAEAFASPQAVARGLVLHLLHAKVGAVPLVANPIKYSGTPIAYGLAPPMLGEHTEEIQSLALKLRTPVKRGQRR